MHSKTLPTLNKATIKCTVHYIVHYSVLYTTLYICSVLYTTVYIYSVLYTTLYIRVYCTLHCTFTVYFLSLSPIRMKVRDCDVLA